MEKKFFGYKAAVGAFLVIFANLGVASTLGVFLTSLASYSGWELGTVGYIGTVNTIGNVILSILAVRFMSRFGTRITALVGVLTCALHTQFYCFVTPGATMTSLILMYIAGFLASFTITFGTHAVCSSIIAEWFVEKRDQVTSIVLSGAGFGAAIWVFLAGQLFKYMDFKGAYRILAVLVLIIGLFAVLVLLRDPKKVGQKPLGWEKAEEMAQAAASGAQDLAGVDKTAAKKTSSFWILAAALLCVCMAGSAFMAYCPSWWQMCGFSATSASNWDALYLLLSGLVLLIVGKVTAKVKPSVFAAIVCISFVICMILMFLLGHRPGTMLMVLIVLFGALAYPINASIPGLMSASIFGLKDSGAVSATLMTAVYIGQALYAPVMAQFLAGKSGMGGGWLFFAGAAIVGMILILISIATSPMKKIRNESAA